jgi:hypothetical protein
VGVLVVKELQTVVQVVLVAVLVAVLHQHQQVEAVLPIKAMEVAMDSMVVATMVQAQEVAVQVVQEHHQQQSIMAVLAVTV